MKGLRTARVVIVDDDSGDSNALLRAFAREGIGAIVYSGDVEDLPRNRLAGIRLVALDMHLDLSVTDERAIIGRAAGYLDALISEENGPYLCIAWTTRLDLASSFMSEASRLSCPPVRVIALEKSSVQSAPGTYDPDLIWASLSDSVASTTPLEFFNLWEQLVHDSATGAVSLLTERAAGDPEEVTATQAPESAGSAAPVADEEHGARWGKRVSHRVARLIRFSSPNIAHAATSFKALLEALNQIQMDLADTISSVAAVDEDTEAERLVGDLCRQAATAKPEGFEADLNRRFLTSRPTTDVRPAPGDVYLATEVAEVLGDDADHTLPDLSQLLRTLGLNEKISTDDMRARLVRVVIEMTPVCDFQNGGMKLAKFIPGVAIPHDILGASKNKTEELRRAVGDASPSSTRSLPTIMFLPETRSPLQGEYFVTLNARFPFTVVATKLIERDVRPIFRVRQQPLLDLQAWSASYAGRPGYLSAR